MLKFFRKNNKRASAVTEYTLLIMAVFGAFFIMQKYIFRGLSGRWKSAGDAFGSGRQYDPGHTKECVYTTAYGLSQYYDAPCMQSYNCPDPKSKKGKRCMAAAVAACTSGCND